MTFDDVVLFLTARLQQPPPGPRAQEAFSPVPPLPGWSPDQVPDTARRAAALLLLYPGPQGPTIPLTVRRADLPHHPGQISLPGGALDAGESVEAAALREAEEEVGLPDADLVLLGRLSTLWIPISNFLVTPVVAISHTMPLFVPHEREVAEVLELPLSWLVDKSRVGWAERTRLGTPIRYPYFDVNGAEVWGATGMILHEFACLFDPHRITRDTP